MLLNHYCVAAKVIPNRLIVVPPVYLESKNSKCFKVSMHCYFQFQCFKVFNALLFSILMFQSFQCIVIFNFNVSGFSI